MTNTDPHWLRGPSHQKPELPAMADVAEMIRAGEALEDIAGAFDRTAETLRDRLRGSGWNADTGEQLTGELVEEEPVDPFEAIAGVAEADWMDDALCAQTDPESFYPDKGGSTRDAKKTCEQCLVRAECLDWALTNDERFGIWGGLSERERRAIKKTLEQGPSDEPAATVAAVDTPINTTPPASPEGAAA